MTKPVDGAEALALCPFCGDVPYVWTTWNGKRACCYGNKPERGSHPPISMTAAEWNTRSPDHRLAGVKEGLEMAAKECDRHLSQFADAENAGDDEAEEAWHGGMAHAAVTLATAIRAIPVKADH